MVRRVQATKQETEEQLFTAWQNRKAENTNTNVQIKNTVIYMPKNNGMKPRESDRDTVTLWSALSETPDKISVKWDYIVIPILVQYLFCDAAFQELWG